MNKQEIEWALRELERDHHQHRARLHTKFQQDLNNAAQWHQATVARLLLRYKVDLQDNEDGNGPSIDPPTTTETP